MATKHTYQFVYDYFKKEHCELLSNEYTNNKTKLKYRCKCGNISEITFSNFKDKNARCRKCGKCEKYTYQEVLEIFNNRNCTLLSEEYNHIYEKLNYQCQCGNITNTTFRQFLRNIGCMKCTGSEKLTYEYVKNFFEKQDYILLSTEYINTMTKLDFICNNGHVNKIEFMSFRKGHRCSKCTFKTERKVYEFLKSKYNNVISQVKFEWCKKTRHLPFDFLLEDYKLIIEVDGGQHFFQFRKSWKNPEEIQENDKYKMKLAIQHNYSIIRIYQLDIYNNKIDWKELLESNIRYYDKPCIIYLSDDAELYKNHIIKC